MSNRSWIILALLAGVMALSDLPRAAMIYFRLGDYYDSPGRIDAYRRWRETHYVVRGRNPYDVAFAAIPAVAHAVNPSDPFAPGRSIEPFPDLGWPEGVVYPPWAFPSMMPMFWPGVQNYLLYYGIWMLAGIAGVAVWAGAEVRGVGQSAGANRAIAAAAVALCALACAAWGGSLVVGNNPPVVVGAMVATYVLLRRERPWLAGVALAIAMLKPTVAAPFLLPLLLDRRWRTLAAAAAVLLLESLLTWRLTWTDPLSMLQQMVAMSRFYSAAGFGPTQYLIHAGLAPSAAAAIVAAVVLILGTIALALARRRTLLARFALAAVVARLWAYHLDYDDAVLVFVLVFFAVEVQSGRSRLMTATFLLVCVSLWMPGVLNPHLAVQLFELLVWTSAALVVACVPGPAPTDPLPLAVTDHP